MNVFLRFSQDVVVNIFGKILGIVTVVRVGDNSARCFNVLCLGGKKFFAIRFDFECFLVVGMPNLEEHLGEGLDRASFYLDNAVFPISESVMIPIDVFVGKVGSACKAGFPVDIHDFVVVAVVQPHIEDWNHRHEFPGFDSQAFERTAKTARG